MDLNIKPGRLRRRVASVAAAIALVAAGISAVASASALPSPAETVGTANFTGTSWLAHTDAPANIVNVGGTLHAITSVGGGGNPWDRWSGTTVDNMGSATSVTRSGFPAGPGYWLTNIWVQPSSGTWYGIVHAEYQFVNGQYAREMGIATSTNLGLTWNWQGWIVTTDTSFTAPAGAPSGSDSFGAADGRLVVDSANGYFYLIYATGYRDPVNSGSQQSKYMNYGAARCAIANIATTTCWTKWYGGSFSQAGIGGHDGNIMPFTGTIHYGDNAGQFSYEDTPAVTYSTSLSKFVAIGHDWISTASSMATQNWSDPVTITGGNATDNCWYIWPVDPSTGSTYSVGSSFRLYGNATGLSGCSGGTARYQDFNLSGNPAATTTWSASNGFTHNQWRFEYATTRGGSTFAPMTYVTAAGINQYQWRGSESYCSVFSASEQHPGNSCDSSRTWQSPINATVTLGSSGAIQVPGSCGQTAGVNIRILKNGTQIWPSSGTQNIVNGGSYSFPSGVTTSVVQGDLIRFVVAGAGPNIACDATTWNATLTANTGLQNIVWKASDGYTQGWDQWRYEYTTNGTTFTAMQYDRFWRWWSATSVSRTSPQTADYCLVFSPTEQHPGVGCQAARTWVSPYTGTATIKANGPITVGNGCSGNTAGVNARILKNGTQIWPSSGSGTIANGGSVTFPSGGITQAIVPGDKLQFIVGAAGAGTNNCGDNTTWNPNITLVP